MQNWTKEDAQYFLDSDDRSVERTRAHYKLNGIDISITSEMVQDLNGPIGPTVEKHIIKLYKEKIAEIRDFKLNSLGI